MTRRSLILAVALTLATMTHASDWENSGPMREALIRYNADQGALNRMFPFDPSLPRMDRFEQFYKDWLAELEKVDFEALPPGGRADWVMLKNQLDYELENLTLERQRLQETTESLLPFWDEVVDLVHTRVLKTIPEPKEAAQAQNDLLKAIQTHQRQLNETEAAEPVARRALTMVSRATDRLEDWYEYYSGYDPLFTWWNKKPYEDLTTALQSYREALNKRYFDGQADSATAIKGDPIGEAGFKVDLKNEMVSYSVRELLEIGRREMAWVDQELIKASRELGFGDDWKAAMEHVKNLYPEPGDQPRVVFALAEEAQAWLDKNDYLTVPPLARETWRSVMMSPQRQLVSPFFLGGETIWISYPTDTMAHEQKLMSMRGNNRYFSKATVHHELIPGHHLQQYMNSRYNTHRRGVVNTPFWVEGWALYWEFKMYKEKFAATPEERIGFLFWRKHRAVRIVFSLSFHLGEMTADECVKMLVEEGRHEQSTAEGEVRRSFEGSYPPLYQAAYMLGAFQLWDIRREVVDSGKMTEKQFHDAVLQLGNTPWAITRALLKGEEIKKDFDFTWDFYKGPIQSPW